MNYDNDDRQEYSENLDRYVEEEMLKHYGRNVMHNSVQPQKTPTPYKKIHSKGFFSVMSIICAVLFLTGVGVLSGVIFSSGVPVNGTISSTTEIRSNSSVNVIVSDKPELYSSESASSKAEVSGRSIIKRKCFK